MISKLLTHWTLAFVTVLSLGVPISKVFPKTKIKSIVSLEDNVPLLGKNVIVAPETLNELNGDCITPFKDTSICKADSGTNATESCVRLYVFVLEQVIVSSLT